MGLALLLWHFWLPAALLLVALDGTAALAASALLRSEAAPRPPGAPPVGHLGVRAQARPVTITRPRPSRTGSGPRCGATRP